MPPAQISKLLPDELDTNSQISALRKLLSDRETLIDNLIARAGVLESNIVAKQEYAENLAREFEAQAQHIKELNAAIEQRDKYVETLERDRLNISPLTQAPEDGISSLLQSNRDTQKKLVWFEELNEATHQRINELHRQSSAQVPALEQAQINLASKLDQTFELLSKTKGESNSELKKVFTLLESLQSRINLINTDELNSSIEFLTNKNSLLLTELGIRDQWGLQAQQRLNELSLELSTIKKSSSWKITAPLRVLTEGIKNIIRHSANLVLLPYRVATHLAWRIAPKLMHKVYHSDRFKRLAGRSEPGEPFDGKVEQEVAPPDIPPRHEEQKAQHPGALANSNRTPVTVANKKTITRLDRT